MISTRSYSSRDSDSGRSSAVASGSGSPRAPRSPSIGNTSRTLLLRHVREPGEQIEQVLVLGVERHLPRAPRAAGPTPQQRGEQPAVLGLEDGGQVGDQHPHGGALSSRGAARERFERAAGGEDVVDRDHALDERTACPRLDGAARQRGPERTASARARSRRSRATRSAWASGFDR
ncbi:MAG TPA: hypothetical protein VEA81_03470 [Burkholderiaceae bacterium]|nr:hypothetical protein [Burkholderiaceae bacterium]